MTYEREDDVATDDRLANSRTTGGATNGETGTGDETGTTGTGDTEEYVGRVAGDDEGYAGETGAERRAEEG